MSRPTQIPRWSSDPGPGLPGSIEPPNGKKDDGFENGEEPAAGHFNWLFHVLCGWAGYLSDAVLDSERLAMSHFMDMVQGSNPPEIIRGVASSPTDIVAVGDAGTIVRNTGLATAWSTPSPDAGYASNLLGVAWDPVNERFSAVGQGGEVQDSPTGAVWTRRHTGGGDLKAVASNGAGHVVAVGASGHVMNTDPSAPDTWTDETSAYPGQTMQSIAYGAGYFVAVGAAGRTMRSVYGETWTPHTIAGTPGDFLHVVWSDYHGLFFASSIERTYTSPDGVAWTLLINHPGVDLSAVIVLREHVVWLSDNPISTIKMFRIQSPLADPFEMRLAAPGSCSRVYHCSVDSVNQLAGRAVVFGGTAGLLSVSGYLGV